MRIWASTEMILSRSTEATPSSRLLSNKKFSTDYPHWQFDGDEVLPAGISPDLVRKIMIDNPLATYGRLKQCAKETTP